MRELSPQARSLIQRMQCTDGPSIRDRERMRARLAPLLTTGSVVAAATAPTAAAAAAATTAPLSTATGAACLSGTLAGVAPVVAAKLSAAQVLLWGALGLGAGFTTMAATVALTAPSPPNSPMASAKTASAHPSPGATDPVTTRGIEPNPRTEGLSERTAAAPMGPASAIQSVRRAVAQAEPGATRAAALTGRDERSERALPGFASTLAEETRLLRAAQAARRAGRAALALELLGEHARRFPHGILRTERSVTQALALCAQGRAEASDRLREKILDEAPSLPAASRIREPCAGGRSR